MSLHLNEWGDSSPRAEQPRRAGARARKPATLSHLPPIAAVAVPAGCRAHSETWSLLRLSPGVQQRSRRPRCTPMGPAPKVHEYHDAGFSLPVVVVRARFGLLPRIGRDRFNQALNDCTDRLEVVVHRIAPLSATLRVSCQACGHPHGAREGALVRRSPASPGGGNGRHPAGRRGPPGQGTNRP